MDGGTITAPNLAIWTPEEGWIVENEGVAPGIPGPWKDSPRHGAAAATFVIGRVGRVGRIGTRQKETRIKRMLADSMIRVTPLIRVVLSKDTRGRCWVKSS
jgi:hypothetical protein